MINPNEGPGYESHLDTPYPGISEKLAGSYEKLGVGALLVVNRSITCVKHVPTH